jgi:hypothetical protein
VTDVTLSLCHHTREAKPTDKIREAPMQSARSRVQTLVDSTTPRASHRVLSQCVHYIVHIMIHASWVVSANKVGTNIFLVTAAIFLILGCHIR